MSDTNELVERLRPLDLSNLLQHAFRSGFEIAGGSADAFSQWWPEYDPEECAAYPRVVAALSPVEAVPVVKPLEWETRSETFIIAAVPDLKLYYGISFIDGTWVPQWEGSGYQADELSEIMAAAQADCERGVLSALAHLPTQAGAVMEAVREALIFYENHGAGCRLIHSGGDASRNALAKDGGKRAKDALAALTAALGAQTPPEGAVTEAQGWRPIETAPKDEEVLVAYWRWRNSMSPGSVVVQSARQTEFHGEGIWSWVVSDNKHGPFPIRGWSEGDIIGWRPSPPLP